jgi:hypothetical protein
VTAHPMLPPEWPGKLTANAWTGEEAASGALDDEARTWAVRDHFAGRPEYELAAQKRADLEDWADPRVGWGLVLQDDPALSYPERARADDAPVAARRLAEARSATGVPVVLRYNPDDDASLYRYYDDGSRHPLPITGEGVRGMGRGGLPYYLLLLGTPERLPWELQFRLNPVCCTGRLDLDENGLANYVNAALCSWSGSGTKAESPLLWTVQHEPGDITWLMRQSVGERVFKRWRHDPQIGKAARALRDEDATSAQLRSALSEISPAIVVTTSHGMTGPLQDMAQMRSTLGRLVDANHAPLDPTSLLGNWSPDGVVWYALACCSAGGSGRNQFEGLLSPQTRAARVVEAVSALGAMVTELPRVLLGASRPARAFIGHVEPTFDWTLRRADSGLVTTDALVEALYDEFFQVKPPPVGFALRRYFGQAATLRALWAGEVQAVRRRDSARSASLLAGLAGIDRQCTVILGDPAVAPAALPRT